MAKPPPRIYVDCSFIDFTKQPTGIPRVVLKYLEVGYAWGRRNNVEVIPVVPVADGLIICRPVPGAGAPRALLEKIETSETGSIQAKARLAAKNTLKYLRNIAHHCLFLLASVFPITP